MDNVIDMTARIEAERNANAASNSPAIGQKVVWGRDNSVALVYERQGQFYAIVTEDGRRANHLRVGSLSPFTRITPVEPVEVASREEIDYWLARAEIRKAADDLAKAEQKLDDDAETARLVAFLKATYPQAKPQGGRSRNAWVAANIRAELKASFPGVTFQVKANRPNGCSSVDVEWTEGPTETEVKEIVNKYQAQVSSQSVDDRREYDRSPFGRAVAEVLGRVTLVMTYRNFSPETWDRAQRGLAALQLTDYTGPDTVIMPDGAPGRKTADVYAGELLKVTSFPPDFNGAFTVEHRSDLFSLVWSRIVF